MQRNVRWQHVRLISRHDGIVPDDVADVSPEFLDESKTRFYEKEELEKRTRKQAESEEKTTNSIYSGRYCQDAEDHKKKQDSVRFII